MEYCRIEFRGVPVVVRDLEETDVETFVRYWHESDAAYLSRIGVDVRKLRAPDETRKLFRDSIRRGPEQERVALVFSGPDGPLGYTNLHRIDADHVYAHVHLVRNDARGAGLLSRLFVPVVAAFFEHFRIRRLTFQTSVTNRPVNALIQKFGLTPERRIVEAPDGMARAGEMLVYELSRRDVERLQARAAARPRVPLGLA